MLSNEMMMAIDQALQSEWTFGGLFLLMFVTLAVSGWRCMQQESQIATLTRQVEDLTKENSNAP